MKRSAAFLVSSVESAAQATVSDPWKRVPALPGQLTGVLDYLTQVEAVYAIRYGNARPPGELILIK